MTMSVYQNWGKRGIDIFFSLLGIIFLWPIFLVLTILIKLDSPGPAIFKQKRVGKNGKIFTMYKFRTMVKNAEKLKEKYRHLNEADGPVFKIKNDPRYTNIGKILSHTGLDELPQLFNILKGEMSLVGPRPLPVEEEAKIAKEIQVVRRKAPPGLACSWLVNGAHELKFPQWLKFDIQDVEKSSFFYDLNILRQTAFIVLTFLKINLTRKNGTS